MINSSGVLRISSKAVKSSTPLDSEFEIVNQNDGKTGGQPISITAGREGGIWVGTVRGGLKQITPQAFKVYSGADWHATDDNVYPIYEDSDNSVWLGAWGNSLVNFKDGKFFTYHLSKSEIISVTSIFEDSQKELLIGTQHGVFARNGDRFENVSKSYGLAETSVVFTISEDRDHNLWFGTESGGLVRYKDGRSTEYTTKDGLPDDSITAFLELKDGRIVVGTKNGLAFFENEKFRVLTEQDGLASNYVRSLYEDKSGVLWIGTYENGLSRYNDGEFKNFTINDGLYSKNVFCILEDDNGWFWMNSNIGIYRVSRQQLEDFADNKISKFTSIAYTTKDGLLNAEGNGGKQPAGIKRRNGELWFPTLRGAAVIDPSTIVVNPLPPPIHYDEILVDGKDIGAYSDEITLEPGQRNIEINYTALSFINPELLRFRYRLEGFDEKWIEAGTRRSANYAKLPPGEYTFRLQAANRDGVWNTGGKTIKFIVPPYFYETYWFTALVVMIIAGLILFAFIYRGSKLKQIARGKTAFAKQLIASQEAERKRIANELHDGLGQSLVIIKNRAILGGEDKDFGEFDEISNTASNALREVREIIYDLRPQHLERIGLTRAISAMLKRAKGIIEFKEDIDSIDGLFSENVDINVYRIVQECINNIIKHSEATNGTVTIKHLENRVKIMIADNGRGFDLENTKAKHSGFGLNGLQERVELLDGSFEIDSRPGDGTTILIVLPVSIDHVGK